MRVCAGPSAQRVDQQLRRAGVVRHNHILVAVIVDVAEGRPPPDLRLLKDGARLARHILESPVPQVAKQQFRLMHRKRFGGPSFGRLHATVDR